MSRFLINGTKRLVQISKNIRWSSSSLTSSHEVIEKYGQHVPVSVPLVKDVIDYPEPVMHKDYVEVRRMTHEWASKYWDSQKITDYLLTSDWPYLTGYHVPHIHVNYYLATSKGVVWIITLDHKMDTDYDSEQRKQAYNNLSKFLFKFYFNLIKNKPDAFEHATYDNETASMDGSQLMTVDLFLQIGSYKWNEAWFEKMTDWFMGYLNNDLKHKKDENFAVTFDEYFNIRQVTFGSEFFFKSIVILESGDSKADEKLLKVPEFKRFFYLCEFLTILSNDVRSFQKEQSRNDHWANAVTVYAREKGAPLQDGVKILLRNFDNAITEFQNLGWRLAHDSNLNQRFPHLKHLIEVSMPNYVYGAFKTYDINGGYKTDAVATTNNDSNPIIGTRIDPAMLYKRVKKQNLKLAK